MSIYQTRTSNRDDFEAQVTADMGPAVLTNEDDHFTWSYLF
jgi:hypothetical protein